MIDREDDDDDGLDDVTDFDLKDELTHKMRTVGALVAYRTALAICKDSKATAAAKASAVNSLFRAGGFFAAQDPGAGTGKELHEMTADELRAASLRAHAGLAALGRTSPGELPSKPDAARPKKRSGSIFD